MIARPAITVAITHLDLGGAENVALALAEGLRETIDFHVFVVMQPRASSPLSDAMAARLQRAGVKVSFGTSRPFKRGGVIEAALRLRRHLRRHPRHLLHLHTEIPELTAALALALPGMRPRNPILRTIHNTVLWGGWGMLGMWTERQLREASVVAVSNAALEAENALRAKAGLLPPAPERRQVIYNGVAAPTLMPTRGSCGPVRVLFAGRFELQKGADLIPGIVAEAQRRTQRRVEMTIAGSGSLAPFIQRNFAVGASGWPVEVRRPIPELAGRFSEFDIVLMPSRFEGLPLVAVEALLAGLPVVATRCAGLTEVIPADDPLSAPVDDVRAIGQALAFGIETLAKQKSRIAAARPALLDRFGREQMLARYQALYARLAPPA